MTPYDQGFEAWVDDKLHTDNPYRLDSVEYKEWLDGFQDAVIQRIQNIKKHIINLRYF
jgi:hypothetical protein